MTPINTIINQYVANPKTIDQKECNIKIVENVTEKIKRGWRDSSETCHVANKKERIATIESLKTADQANN